MIELSIELKNVEDKINAYYTASEALLRYVVKKSNEGCEEAVKVLNQWDELRP